MTAKIKAFLNEVRAELGKVSWPARNVLKVTTGVITIFMVLIALFVGIIDIAFSKLISVFLR